MVMRTGANQRTRTAMEARVSRQTVITVIDDINGEEGASPEKFGLDGFLYEIDLTDANGQRLRESLAPFITKARRVGRYPYPTRRAGARVFTPAPIVTNGNGNGAADESIAMTREMNQEIRRWWKANYKKLGLPVPNERGRIPLKVVAKWRNR
jgi:hypothetical protein